MLHKKEVIITNNFFCQKSEEKIANRRLDINVYVALKERGLWVKVKVKFTLQQAMKAQTGSRGIALLFP